MPPGPKLSKLPGLEDFSIGDCLVSEDGSKKVTIIDYESGAYPIGFGAGFRHRPSIKCEIESPNPDYNEGKVAFVADFNAISRITRRAIGLEEMNALAPPAPTRKETVSLGVPEFLELIKGLTKAENDQLAAPDSDE